MVAALVEGIRSESPLAKVVEETEKVVAEVVARARVVMPVAAADQVAVAVVAMAMAAVAMAKVGVEASTA